MKTLKYITFAAVALVLTGCNFFDSQSPSAMDAATVFSNVNSTEQAIAGIYEQFGQDKSYRNRLACGYQGMNTDVEHGSKNSGRADWNIYNLNPANGDLSTANGKDPWGYLNSAIERCNNVIEGIEEYGDTVLNTDEKKNETVKKMRYLLGEAYFLRSFCYFQMVQLWGDVPARFVSISKDEEGLKTKKSDRTNVLKQIRIDLKKAAELMPWSSQCPGTAANYTGRPSKGAAYALLARVDLAYAGKGVRPDSWKNGPVFLVEDANLRQELNTEVMWACAQIINNGNESSKFQVNYEDIFKKICADETNYYNSEVFWEIAFADGNRGQVLQYNCTKMDKALGGLKNNEGGSSNSSVTIVPTLYYDFEDGDVRRDVTMARYIWVYDDGSEFNSSDRDKIKNVFPGVDVDNHEKFLYQKPSNVGDWFANKYRVEWMRRNRTGNDDGINFPIIRYADVLLMAAEASIGGIGGDVPTNMYGINGAQCFNMVRTRAHASTKELTMANIQEERKFEFTGEYIRKYDLMRWGILKETLENAHERLEKMNKHEGDYADLQDTVYIKFKNVGDIYSFAAGIKGFVIDSTFGLTKKEKGEPAYKTGWAKGNIYESSSGRHLAPDNYMLFDREYPERLNGRQLWPIFSVNVGQSEGALWNDYDYVSGE